MWTYPENGQILRMWQPFNGLNIYPPGVNGGPVDINEFQSIPPLKCRSGGATFRTGCDENGYPSKKYVPMIILIPYFRYYKTLLNKRRT